MELVWVLGALPREMQELAVQPALCEGALGRPRLRALLVQQWPGRWEKLGEERWASVAPVGRAGRGWTWEARRVALAR